MNKLLFLLIFTLFASSCSNINEPSDQFANNCIESRIFFGLSSGEGMVTESQWNDFVRNDVVKYFPSGFSVIDVNGYFRECDTCETYSENSKMLLVVYSADLFQENIKKIEQLSDYYLNKFNRPVVLISSDEVNCDFHFKK